MKLSSVFSSIVRQLPLLTCAIVETISAQANAQQLEESGWAQFNYGGFIPTQGHQPISGNTMWVPAVGAFRNSPSIEDNKVYVDDTSFIVWAMSKLPRYQWSGLTAQGYPQALRNYLIGMSADNAAPIKLGNGSPDISITAGPEFSKGHIYQNGSWVRMANATAPEPVGYPVMSTDGSDTAIVSFAPSLALVSITTAYPTFITNGTDNTAWLQAHIARILSHQDDIVQKISGIAVIGSADKRIFSTSIAFHMLASAVWYQYTNNVTYLQYAQRAWNVLKLRQNTSSNVYTGAFVDFGNPNNDGSGNNYSVLRHAQILAAMVHTNRIIGDYNGLGSALTSASNALKTVNSTTTCSNGWTIYQGHYLGSTPCSLDAKGGMGNDGTLYSQNTITSGFAYLGQICHNSPQAVVGMRGITAARRTSAQSGYITGEFFNTFGGNRSIANGVFADNGTYYANDQSVVTGTLEANAMVWLARWWQTQATGC